MDGVFENLRMHLGSCSSSESMSFLKDGTSSCGRCHQLECNCDELRSGDNQLTSHNFQKEGHVFNEQRKNGQKIVDICLDPYDEENWEIPYDPRDLEDMEDCHPPGNSALTEHFGCAPQKPHVESKTTNQWSLGDEFPADIEKSQINAIDKGSESSKNIEVPVEVNLSNSNQSQYRLKESDFEETDTDTVKYIQLCHPTRRIIYRNRVYNFSRKLSLSKSVVYTCYRQGCPGTLVIEICTNKIVTQASHQMHASDIQFCIQLCQQSAALKKLRRFIFDVNPDPQHAYLRFLEQNQAITHLLPTWMTFKAHYATKLRRLTSKTLSITKNKREVSHNQALPVTPVTPSETVDTINVDRMVMTLDCEERLQFPETQFSLLNAGNENADIKPQNHNSKTTTGMQTDDQFSPPQVKMEKLLADALSNSARLEVQNGALITAVESISERLERTKIETAAEIQALHAEVGKLKAQVISLERLDREKNEDETNSAVVMSPSTEFLLLEIPPPLAVPDCPERFYCTACPKFFYRKDVLKKHLNSIHGPDKYIPCNKCKRNINKFRIKDHTCKKQK